MKKHNGKRSRQKPETNFVDAYSGASTLPPPPAMKDVSAVPAKLRKIMQLKSSAAQDYVQKSRQTDGQFGKKSGKSLSKVQKKDSAGLNPIGSLKRDTRITGPEINSERPVEKSVPTVEKRKRRREKEEAELSMLLEKMDRRVKPGISKGVTPRRKSYLEAKKRKKRPQEALKADPLLDFPKHDKVEFGEIVQAPPKLSFPARATQVKMKEESQRHGSAFLEKARLQAIEAYRQRKGASSRLGGAQVRV